MALAVPGQTCVEEIGSNDPGSKTLEITVMQESLTTEQPSEFVTVNDIQGLSLISSSNV